MLNKRITLKGLNTGNNVEDLFNQVINNHVINLEINNIFNYKKPKNIYKNLPSKFKTKKQLLNVTFNDIINIGNKYFNNLDVLCI